MLALPLISQGLGFPMLAGLLLLCWVFMALAALITLETNLAISPGATLFVMARETLGKAGFRVCTLAMTFLFYSLLAAYIAGGGEQLISTLSAIFPLSLQKPVYGMVLFVLIFGAISAVGARYVDSCNRVLFLLMMAVFLVALTMLLPGVEVRTLQQAPTTPWHGLAVIPVIFTSFGYHGSIPSLIAYVGGEQKQQLRTVFLLGSFIPLVLYLLWLAATLGQSNGTTLLDNGSVTGMIEALAAGTTDNRYQPWFVPILSSFTNLALVTSFLGVGLGFFDFMHSATASKSRLQTAVIVFLPPLLVAWLIPDAFVAALGFAAFALAILAILLPAAMAWRLKQQGKLTRWPGGVGFWPTVAFGVVIALLSLTHA